jgi:hypothetical protein
MRTAAKDPYVVHTVHTQTTQEIALQCDCCLMLCYLSSMSDSCAASTGSTTAATVAAADVGAAVVAAIQLS